MINALEKIKNECETEKMSNKAAAVAKKTAEVVCKFIETHEEFAEENDISIIYKEKTLRAYNSRQGTIYMDSQYLTPLSPEGLEIYIRYIEGKIPYFVCKNGMMISAIIAPYSRIKDDEHFKECLAAL